MLISNRKVSIPFIDDAKIPKFWMAQVTFFKYVIFGVKIMQFLIPGQNFGTFASPTKGLDTFLFEMSMK